MSPGSCGSWYPHSKLATIVCKRMFLEAENKCLEGNRLDPQAVLGGASFLDDCQDVTGQLWRFVDAGNGYYRCYNAVPGS